MKDATGRGAGYRYFGAAKSLPGVKELFERAPAPKVLFRVVWGVRLSFLLDIR